MRIGRAPSTGEPDEMENRTTDMHNVIKNAGAKTTIAIITGRADAVAIIKNAATTGKRMRVQNRILPFLPVGIPEI